MGLEFDSTYALTAGYIFVVWMLYDDDDDGI